ncbi:MAG: pyridoxamine 5'-phosphate oxidase [Bacteroidetes bacterium]|nr:pyridoxamine 5'-phosphate oxidase [Bacteroidota bacterium]
MAALDEARAGDDPLALFMTWFSEAEAAEITEVNAMVLATCDSAGKPHARIVLLKGLDATGFVFYTNYNSAKGRQIAANPNASLVFFWKELERQVRIEGIIEKVSDADSDAYFQSRPADSRLGAWASNQSSQIADRQVLDDNYAKFKEQFGENIPRPEHWGGYRLVPQHVEFWQGRSNRMHDRICFQLSDGKWAKSRLAP